MPYGVHGPGWCFTSSSPAIWHGHRQNLSAHSTSCIIWGSLVDPGKKAVQVLLTLGTIHAWHGFTEDIATYELCCNSLEKKRLYLDKLKRSSETACHRCFILLHAAKCLISV